MTRVWKGIFASIFFCAAGIAVSAAPQNLENFARRPQMHGVSISDDGRYIAFLSGSGDETILMTFDRTQAGGAFKRVTASEPNKFDIGWCRWATNSRVVCGIYGNIRGKKYAEPPFKRLFAVNADGTALKTLEEERNEGNLLSPKTSARNVNMNYGAGIDNSNRTAMSHTSDFFSPGGVANLVTTHKPERQDEVIDFTPNDPDSVLIQADDDKDGYPSILQININTANRSLKMLQSPPIQMFVTDGHGNPRLGWGTSRAGETSYFAKLGGERDWRQLATAKAAGERYRLRPIAIATEPDTAYAFGIYEGRDALWNVDLADKREPKLLFKHPLVDVGEPIVRTDGRLLGVRYDVERPYVWYADPKHRELIDRLEAQFPNRVFDIIDSTEDQKLLVLQASSDVDFGTFYLYDVEKDKLQKLGTAYPELDQKSLGTMTNILYKAADGTEIPGYLTVPTGGESKNLPLIVIPHDGPATRDSWNFSYLRVFLANRGYAVLQMNYRGSTGFGDKWRADAHQDWGGLVYSDIQDATKWAVSQGIADPKRICILGSGFAGYEALLSAARNDGTYKCAIGIGAIVDLELQLDLAPQFDRTAKQEIGVDKEKFERDSPLANASKISIPVLLIHGDKDWQVQLDHLHKMENALDKHDKDVTVVEIKNGTHELERRSDRLTVLKEVEAFLDQHIK
jgi:dipeptidyl aminopeptidase/acylaminoacyl peptidase